MQIKPDAQANGSNPVPIEVVNNTNPADAIIEIRTPTQVYKIPVSMNQYSINIYPIGNVQAPTGATQLHSFDSGPLQVQEQGFPQEVPQQQPVQQPPLAQRSIFANQVPQSQSPATQSPNSHSPNQRHAAQPVFTFGSAPRRSPLVVRGEYAQKLDQLSEMGFDMRKKNIKLLNRFNGDVSAVVQFYQKKMNKSYDRDISKAGRITQKLKFLREPNPRAKPVKQEYLNLYASQLHYLNQQGFRNNKLNVKLLYKFNGSTVSVINWIQGRDLLLQSKFQLVNDSIVASPKFPHNASNVHTPSPTPVVFQQPTSHGSPVVIFSGSPTV
jgi:hypothetical protein